MSWKRDHIIYKKEGSYACFPTLQKLDNGWLLVALTEREWPSHYSKGRVRVFLSADGEDWQETQDRALPPLWKGATGKFRCQLDGGAWLDMGAGGLGGHCDAAEVRPAAERAQWEEKGYSTADHEIDPELFYLNGKELNIGKSVDGGETWQHRSIGAPDEMVTLNAFRGLQRTDGTLLLPVGGRAYHPGLEMKELGTASWRQYMVRSTDGGESWEWTKMVEDPTGAYTEEVTLLELDNDRVLALVRAHRPGPTGYLWQQWSADGGRTWSEPVETQIWGYPCHLLSLADGRILCTYGYRFKPAGIRAVLSDNDGWSWDIKGEIILRDDGGTPAQGWGAEQLEKFKARGVAGADLGYPFSVQLADGSIVTVYYFTGTDRITHAVATKWRLER